MSRFDPIPGAIYHVVEIFYTLASIMSSVNYSVPDEVKKKFNETFKGRNKSAIIAELMMQAVEREERRARHRHAVDRILHRREDAPGISDEEIHDAREQGRP